ncbi:MAG: DedA family protein [Rhodobacteraceae bacterium]|nr:DedA family protein [Paracoccaceae bacterium]
MSDYSFLLVSTYGAPIILAATLLSCLAIPMPSSVIMLAGGAFVASGDLGLAPVLAAAFGGAILGDNLGYQIGRSFGPGIITRLEQKPSRRDLIAKARAEVRKRGGVGVFFSTWLFAPLGPWVNLVAGATGLGRRRFMFWDTAGEAIWVAVYVGLGYGFAGYLDQVSDLLENSVGLLSALVLVVILGLALRRATHQAKH